MSRDIMRQEFFDAVYGSIAASQGPGTDTVPSPRGPLKVEPDGSVTSFWGIFNSAYKAAKTVVIPAPKSA